MLATQTKPLYHSVSHVASDEHLLGYVLAVPFVLIGATIRSLWEYVLEIRL